MAKMYELKVKTGSYTDVSGQSKNRYETIGSVMEGQNGGQYMLLKRTFNPAGVEVESGRDSVMVSMFEPRAEFEDDIPNKPKGKPKAGTGYEDVLF